MGKVVILSKFITTAIRPLFSRCVLELVDHYSTSVGVQYLVVFGFVLHFHCIDLAASYDQYD